MNWDLLLPNFKSRVEECRSLKSADHKLKALFADEVLRYIFFQV